MVSLRMFVATALLAGLSSTASAVVLSGRVVDSQRQQSYGAAQVSVSPEQLVSSDAQGFFRLPAVAAGPLLLTVELPDGERFRVRLQVPAREKFYVELDRARHVAPADDDEY